MKFISLLFIGITLSTCIWIFYRNRSFVYSSDADISTSLQREFEIENESEWWNDEFDSRVLINPDNTKVLNTQKLAFIEINHEELIKTNKSFFEDGKDLRIIKHGNALEEVSSLIENPNTSYTRIFFTVDDESQSSYFLYYGNEFVIERIDSDDQQFNTEFATELDLGEVEQRHVHIELEKKWHLLGFNRNQDLDLTFKIKVDTQISNMQLVLANENGIIDIKDIAVSDEEYNIDVSSYSPGTYFIKAQGISVNDSLEKIESKTYRFFVSYPIFVNWSLDWEGFAVNQSDLDDISDIARIHSIPLTHYFNPRIYVKEQFENYPISPDLAQYYTNWVLQRKRTLGEEIGLHIHIFPDLLKELEIEVRQDASIIGIGRIETRLNAYTVEELDTIFEWSIQKFNENGLGRPISFRSGAWMSGTNVLQALENNGFAYDSSGRTAGLLNPSVGSSNQIPWNLSVTTKPYKPNRFDINSANTPVFDLWEFPNNGADSYWFSLEELIQRFDINYSYIMNSPQVVTYLSHPHSFKVFDSEKVRNLFSHTSQFSYSEDKGPVVYSTLENIYNNFNLGLF